MSNKPDFGIARLIFDENEVDRILYEDNIEMIEVSNCLGRTDPPEVAAAVKRFGQETTRKGDWFQTYTGKQFYILDPRPEDFCIEDVAHALSNQCRYNGHTDRFYSVAEHSIILALYVLNNVRQYPNPQWVAYKMLMHDGVEAYISDIPRPVKNSIPELEAAELLVELVYAKKFRTSAKLCPPFKELDKRIVVDEKRALMVAGSDHVWEPYNRLVPLGVEIVGLVPEVAERRFLDLYAALRP